MKPLCCIINETPQSILWQFKVLRMTNMRNLPLNPLVRHLVLISSDLQM